MKSKDYTIRAFKKAYRLASRKSFLNPECNMDRSLVNELIYNILIRDEPCMISRFGTTELNCINNYLCVSSNTPFYSKFWDYVSGNTHTPWWNEDHFQVMSIYSGIFPPGRITSENFSRRYLSDIPEMDVLGSFQYYEKYMPLRVDVKKVHLETLYPFFVENPWTRALAGKKILVVHPFDVTIRNQYNNKKGIFERDDILPDYELITFRAVQSVAGTKVPFDDWFAALKYMEDKVSDIDFDICLIGCGAYGLPLAAHVKRMGKKAFHIGGGLQLLYGIKGKRWEEQYDRVWDYRPGESININYVDLFNDKWVYPDTSERPANSSKVENSCYW